MTLFYKGTMIWGVVTGSARDGRIFEGFCSGTAPATIMATYRNGWVYEGILTGFVGNVIGRYKNGFIYRGSYMGVSTCVGRYQNGFIYRGTLCHFSNAVGRYKGSDEEGAALGIYYLFRK